MTKIYKINIIQKLIIYLLIACILPIMIFGIFIFNKTNRVLKSEINKFSYEILKNKQNNLELIMDNVESLIINISSLDDIRNILRDDYKNNSYNKLATQAHMGYILSGYSNLKGLVSIDLFSVNGTHYHVGDTLNIKNIDNELQKKLFAQALKSDKTVVWSGVENNVNKNSSYDKVITASKIIRVVDSNTVGEKPIGLLLVNYDINEFTKNIIQEDFPEAKNMIIDAQNRVVYYPEEQVIGTKVKPAFYQKLNKRSDSFIDNINAEKTIVTYISNEDNWKIISFIPEKVIVSKASAISRNISYLMTVCIILLSLFTLIISKKYLFPIKTITELFKQLKDGSINNNIRLKSKSNDEIGQLILWFNAFMESLYNKKVAEEKLYKSRDQYKTVVNNVKEVIFQTDINGNWTFLNPAWTEITGYGIKESLGNNFINFTHKEDKTTNRELFNKLVIGEIDHCKQTIRYNTKKGNYRWVEVYAKVTLDNSGKIIGASGTLMDITERVKMENEILERERLLKCIADATNILLESTENSIAFNKALKTLGKETGVDRVYIFENHVGEQGTMLTSQRYEWSKEGIKSQAKNDQLQNLSYIDAGIDYWYECMKNHRIISGPIINLPDNEREILKAQGILSVLIVPIFADNKLWGFIGFDDCEKERIWTEIEKDTLKAAAASIGGAVNRIKAEKALQNYLRNDFKKTVQNLQNLVFKLELNKEGNAVFTLFEGRLAQSIGLNTQNTYGKMPQDVMNKNNATVFIDNLKEALSGTISSFDINLDNKIYYVTLSPIIVNNIVHEVVGSAIDITIRRKAEERIKYMAYYDTLTGLPNRSFFTESVYKALNKAENSTKKVCIMFLDLDRFKLINDTLGHEVGDELLKKVADRLKYCTSNKSVVARMGGDEFTILFSEVAARQEISYFAKKILNSFKKSFIIDQYELYITTSIGISCYPENGNKIDSLLKNADIAMYKAKDNGRNTFRFFDSNMNVQTIDRLKMENYLRKAIDNEEFFLKFQPKVNTTNSRITGCEALIRWQNEDLGIIMPSEFINLAEETGLIISMGEWVLKNACKQIKKLHNEGFESLEVSVNISAKQVQQHNFVKIVSDILLETKISPDCLELEITENSIMQNTELTMEVINELKELGVKISIDDFGTGFSSMAYLKRFWVDKLKIDKSFITDITTNKNDAEITSAIISMAHALNLSVVAEGVETKEQLMILKEYGCDEIQGFLFGKPLDFKDFRGLVINKK